MAVECGVERIVEPLGEHARLEILYGNRLLGNVDERFGPIEEVEANRATLLSRFSVPPDAYVRQKVLLRPYFLDISEVLTADLEPEYETDGLFINRSKVALGLDPADCNAITMFDSRGGGTLGLMHLGRQGVEGDMHLSALEYMVGAHDVPLEAVGMHFSPSVRKASYYYPTIPAEQLADPKWKRFIELQDDGYHIDLLHRIMTDLIEQGGMQPDQMTISPIDVGADTDYFSHVRKSRTGEQAGRNAVAAMLV